MKKLLAMLVLVALVMTACFASAETASDPYMGNARAYLRAMYKNSPVTTTVDYDVVGVVTIADTTYPITWSVDTDAVKIIINDNGMVTIDVNEKSPEEVAYVLTATITSPVSGETVAVPFKHTVPAIATTGVIYVEMPEVGKAYKFALNQNSLTPPATLYLTGEMSGNYLATTTNILKAVDVYIEETDGGYYVYFNAGEAKKYVNITTYTKDDGSLKNTQKIEAAPSVPYTWDAERCTLVADLGDLGKYYLGTYGTYTTISTSNVSYISDITKIGVSQFPAGLYDVQLPNE